jgi:hypothetical protein
MHRVPAFGRGESRPQHETRLPHSQGQGEIRIVQCGVMQHYRYSGNFSLGADAA